MSINVQTITRSYGAQKALDAISFTVRPGEVVGLLGPNGAGKSTLMKILTCYLPPSSGSASVCGFDVVTQSLSVRSKAGYLPENNPLYTDLYVKEFLLFIAGLRNIPGNREKKVREIIEITGLGPEEHKKIGMLSRGYRQRVGLAHSLIHDPEVLILDEPTSGLDPNQLIDIRNLIQTIGREKTVMLSTHIMQEVEAICDRVIIIHKGKIVADDLTRNLRSMADSKKVVCVEFDTPVQPSLLKQIPGVQDVKKQPSGNWLISPEGSIDIRPELSRFARNHNLNILALRLEEHKLEEVFQELTKE